MNEPPDLPALATADLDRSTLERLFEDLASAEVLGVLVKPLPAARALPRGVTLAQGREALLRGEVAGIQIHYRHEGRGYRDTLLAAPGGTRLVRIADPPE